MYARIAQRARHNKLVAHIISFYLPGVKRFGVRNGNTLNKNGRKKTVKRKNAYNGYAFFKVYFYVKLFHRIPGMPILTQRVCVVG